MSQPCLATDKVVQKNWGSGKIQINPWHGKITFVRLPCPYTRGQIKKGPDGRLSLSLSLGVDLDFNGIIPNRCPPWQPTIRVKVTTTSFQIQFAFSSDLSRDMCPGPCKYVSSYLCQRGLSALKSWWMHEQLNTYLEISGFHHNF